MEAVVVPAALTTRTTCPPRIRATGSRGARRCLAAEREHAILDRLKALTRYAWDASPFYRRKWDEAGFHPDHLRSLEDFESKVPVVTKKDLRDAQTRDAAFRRLPVHSRGATSITSTAPRAPRDARPRSPSAATTGTPSPMPTPGSCGAWASDRATSFSSRRSSACTWVRGARWPAPSACAPRRSRSARARRA